MFVKSRFFKKTLIYYICIFSIIVIVFSIILYRNIEKEILQTVTTQYDKHATTITTSIETQFSQLYDLGNQLKHMYWLKKACSTSDIIYRYFDYKKCNEVTSDILLYESLLASVDRMGIYLPARDLTITHTDWEDRQSMLYNLSTLIHNEDELSELYTFLRNSEDFTIYNMNIEGFKNAVENDLLICYSVDTIYPSRAILFFYISSATLESILQKNDLSALNSLSVLYKGETICNWNYGNASREDYYIQTSSSLPINVEYRLSFNPPSRMVMYSAFSYLIKIVIWICICCMILAFALAFLTYRPIKKLTTKIAGTYDSKNHDDLQVIEQQYDRIVNEKEQLERSIIQYRSIARNNALSSLLYGVFNSDEILTEQYGIALREESYYRVIILHVEESFKASYYAYIERYNTENGLSYTLLQLADGDFVFIIEEDDSVDFCKLSETMDLLCTYLEENDMEVPYILYGTKERGVVGISMSYQNARESLLSINNNDVSSTYFYPTDWEIQLINLLKLGNSESVSLIFQQIRVENEKRQLSEYIMIKLIKIIFETLLRVAVELDMDTAALSSQFWDNLNSLDSNAKWEYISNVAGDICKKAISVSEDEAAMFSESILEYVKENFSDPLISLAQLQDIFGTSQPSISRLFKKSVKINFNDYLSRLRVENAKILLEECYIKNKRSSCIAEIAKKVGYDSDVTFRRVFKRYEGVTPSQYIVTRVTRGRGY